MPSLCVFYQYDEGDRHNATPHLVKLVSPLDSSRFLFSSLTSLRVVFDDDGGWPCPWALVQSCLSIVMLLLAASPDSFSSLRRLHFDDSGSVKKADRNGLQLPFWLLARLPALTHCRMDLTMVDTTSCSARSTA